ncbi:hypothetical protein [Shouchella patagoniensis]|nr:hypothetical protein [Shouchella patagoniensis]
MKTFLSIVMTIVGLTFGVDMMEETASYTRLVDNPLDLGENHK